MASVGVPIDEWMEGVGVWGGGVGVYGWQYGWTRDWMGLEGWMCVVAYAIFAMGLASGSNAARMEVRRHLNPGTQASSHSSE